MLKPQPMWELTQVEWGPQEEPFWMGDFHEYQRKIFLCIFWGTKDMAPLSSCPLNAQNLFLLIALWNFLCCLFVGVYWKFICPGVFLLNLADSNACLSFTFDLTFITVCVTQLKLSYCDSQLLMKSVTFHFFIFVTQKNRVAFSDKDNGSGFPCSKYD